MNHDEREGVLKNEKGIVRKDGIYFHTASEFALRNLFYLMWGADYTCRPPYRVGRSENMLNAFLLFYIRKGKMRFEYMGTTFTAGEHDAVLIDCKNRQKYSAEEEVDFYWFHFNGLIAQPYYDRISDGKIPLVHSHSVMKYFFDIQDMMRGMFLNEDKFSADVHNILARFVSVTLSFSPEIERAKNFMDAHYLEKCSLDEIAAESSFSKYYFSRQFRKETGLSPHRYIMEARLNYAKRLLTETDRSVEEISEECCFCSSANFIRTFRKSTGFTPYHFRQSLRGL